LPGLFRSIRQVQESPLENPPLLAASTVLVSLLLASPALALELERGLPAQCELGKTCFMQQYPDMDAGGGTADPLCGSHS